MNLGESCTRGQKLKTVVENEFSGNLNIINFRVYPNSGDIYSIKREL